MGWSRCTLTRLMEIEVDCSCAPLCAFSITRRRRRERERERDQQWQFKQLDVGAMQVLWLSMNISPHLATYNLTIEIARQVHGYWVHTNIYINGLDIKLWNILGIKYVCGSFIILNEHCFNNIKVPLVSFFCSICVGRRAMSTAAIEQMASCRWPRMPRWSPDTPLSSSALGRPPPPMQLQKVQDLGRGRIMIIQSRGEVRGGIQRSTLRQRGALFWGHSAITVRRQANLFLLKYLHRSHIPAAWNGTVIFRVDWAEIDGRWSERGQSKNWQAHFIEDLQEIVLQIRT